MMKQISIGKGVLAMGVVLVVALAGAIACIVRELDDGGPIASTRLEVPSPDGKWLATLETVDNGMGFGQGMLYAEVHLHRPHEAITDHGDKEASCVFYIDSMKEGATDPVLRWRDASHLVIAYDSRSSIGGGPGKHVGAYRGVAIEYDVATTATASRQYRNLPATP